MKITRLRGQRRGVSLIELMATMTILTVVLGLTVALLEMLLKLNESGRDHIAFEATIARLGDKFRRDVRDAQTVSRCDEGGDSRSLALRVSDRSSVVEYQILASEVRRSVWDGPELITQSAYPLPSRCEARFERPVHSGAPVVDLVIDRRARKGDLGRVRAMRLKAVLGASHRFDATGEASR